ncbi:MAG: DUF1573 domain-containing protein [Flavobacteriaceae bacterium]|nr:DUF1573 domain-containing protein [Flavobacteriaceae bacterium]
MVLHMQTSKSKHTVKTLFLIAALFLPFFFCPIAFAQNGTHLGNGQIPSIEILGSRIIEVDAKVGDMVEAVFLVRNNTLDDFIIENIPTDCQCTAPVFPKLIPRNSIDSVRIVFNTSNTPPGSFVKKAYLEIPGDKVIELVIQGNLQVIKAIVKVGSKPILYNPIHIQLHSNTVKFMPVEWIKTQHDFGYIKAPNPAITEFRLANRGSGPIVIKMVEPGCSCTISEYSHGNIGPDEMGIVTASYTTKGAFGYFKKFIKVELEDGRIYNLSITGNVEPE